MKELELGKLNKHFKFFKNIIYHKAFKLCKSLFNVCVFIIVPLYLSVLLPLVGKIEKKMKKKTNLDLMLLSLNNKNF